VEGYEEQQQAFKGLVLVHAGPGGEVTTVLRSPLELWLACYVKLSKLCRCYWLGLYSH